MPDIEFVMIQYRPPGAGEPWRDLSEPVLKDQADWIMSGWQRMRPMWELRAVDIPDKIVVHSG